MRPFILAATTGMALLAIAGTSFAFPPGAYRGGRMYPAIVVLGPGSMTPWTPITPGLVRAYDFRGLDPLPYVGAYRPPYEPTYPLPIADDPLPGAGVYRPQTEAVRPAAPPMPEAVPAANAAGPEQVPAPAPAVVPAPTGRREL